MPPPHGSGDAPAPAPLAPPARRRSTRVTSASRRAAPPAVAFVPKKRPLVAEAAAAPPLKRLYSGRNGYVSGPDGLRTCPATAFLGGDGVSVSVVPVVAVGRASPRFKGRGFEAVSPAVADRVCRLEEYWAGNQSGRDAAAVVGVHAFRHVGTVKLDGVWVCGEFEAGSGKEDWGPADRADGVLNLRFGLEKGFVKGGDTRTVRLVRLLRELTDDATSQWPTPLLLALVDARAVKKRRDGPQRAGTLHVHVLAGRLLFELIAFSQLQELFKNLVTEHCEEVPHLPEFKPKFGRSEAVEGEEFYSFPALLRRAESLGYRDLDAEVERRVVAGLAVTLLPFQRDTVQFMVDRATDSRALNDYFWQRISYTRPESKKTEELTFFYYFPLAGEVRLREPPRVRGGACCEEMGLGKTIECLAFVLAMQKPHVPFVFTIRKDQVDCPVLSDGFVSVSKRRLANRDSGLSSLSHREQVLRYGDLVMTGLENDDAPDAGPVSVRRWPAKTTLVVLPPSLLYQWRDEVLEKAPSLVVHVWSRESDASVAVGEAAVDLVLATYEQMQHDKVFSQIHWKSLVLDEAQTIRRSMTAVARDAFNLRADSRFLMTGTPVTNSLDDISGELAFLKIWPFTLDNDGFWERCIEEPWKNRASSSLLDTLLSGTMMRHTKGQDGIGIALPRRTYRSIQLPLSGSTLAVYTFIRSCAEQELERLQSESHPQLRHVRSLFNLLRASCVSAQLVSTFALDFARRVVWAARMRAANPHLADSHAPLLDWRPEAIAKLIALVSAEDALEFVGAANGGILRDTKRSFAIGQVEPALDPRYTSLSMEELVAEVCSKELTEPSEAPNLSRERLIGLLAGGLYRLATDSIQDMRRQVLAAHLLPMEEAEKASKSRLTSLLKNHIRLSNGFDVNGTVHQSGFDTLEKLREGEVPDCPVCLDGCTRPCITACAHFYCHECVVALIGSLQGCAKCALCRRAIVANKVAEINRMSIGRRKTTEDDESEDDEVDDDVAEELNASQEQDNSATDRNTVESEADLEDESVSVDSAAIERAGTTVSDLQQEYERIPAPIGYDGLGYNPSTPSLDVNFLRHLACAQAEPTKFHALAELIKGEAADEKFVVVAEAASTLQACGIWLGTQGIECVGVGMDTRSAASRVHSMAAREFRSNPAKRVFLLNTSSSSGLTLTTARTVVFLEPLFRKADEIQASARVHRIGQLKHVKIVRMVASGTVEEGVIAARGGEAPATVAEEASALCSVAGASVTDDVILKVFGWQRAADGRIRRRLVAE